MRYISLRVTGTALDGWHFVHRTARLTAHRVVIGRGYPLMAGLAALLVTVSMTIPFVSILIAAILLRRERWLELVLVSSLGSATGGVLLYLMFHHLGWASIIAAYPDLLQSKAWADATRWVSAYGSWALFGIAASPLPQTPALIFTALSRLPLLEVFLALLAGKLLKYGMYGFLAARCPGWLRRRRPRSGCTVYAAASGTRRARAVTE